MGLNINGTTGISGVEGSVSAPVLTGTDSNCGISFPAADTIKFSTGGVERIVINNSGISGTGISAASDFVKIATATWTSAVASVDIDSLDTTTYKYFVMLWNSVPATDNTNLQFRWRSGGSDATGSSYDWAISTNYGYSTTGQSVNDDAYRACFAMGNNAWEGCQLEFVIYPKSSAEAGYQGNSVFMNGFYETNGGSPRSTQSASFYDGGTTYYPNGFKIYSSSGDLATGNYALYGVKR